ncbi:hypothetical protein PINS_up011146 [Pythium insidiosum]|nr:hypothetical protein PINS_up011146 [Pythium insidiosum]
MDVKRRQHLQRFDSSPLSVAAWPASEGFIDMLRSCEIPTSPQKPMATEGRGLWTSEEHTHFVEGIKMYPSGPWKDIAAHVGTRTARQTMTHAQKYRQKIARRLRNARLNTKQPLPFNLDASCPQYNALLSSEEQFNDSIMSTTLAIAAERELDMFEELLGTSTGANLSPMHNDSLADAFQPLTPTSRLRFQHSAMAMDTRSCDISDMDFDECIDFLIARLHEEPLP